MRGLNGAISVARALRGNATAVGAFRRPPRATPSATCWTINPQSLVDRSSDYSTTSLVRSNVTWSRYYGNAFSKEGSEVVLFQYEACPFCNKVKAFLEYYDVRYKVVEVNPINKKQIKWSYYGKVPTLMVDGEQLVNSSEIINYLVKRINPGRDLYDKEEMKWCKWVDTHLVHVLSTNIYRTVDEALESFEYITTKGNFRLYERLFAKYGQATAMYFRAKKLKERHNITDERAALYEAAEKWVDALNGRKFHGGSQPNLADLSVFGVLRSIRHLQSGRDMVEHTRIGNWFSEMEHAVGQASRVSEHK